MWRKKIIVFVALLVVISGVIGAATYVRFFSDSSSVTEKVLKQGQQNDIAVVADNLDTPWSITELPDSRLLVTERSGVIRILGDDGRRFEIADVVEQGEGGLLGIALDPDFATNSHIYIYKTTGLTNLVERYRLNNDKLAEQTAILTDIPAASNHNGGEIRFGPDDKLYVATGDASQENLAQDRRSLAGKILRINADGSIPTDNPFGNAIWSYGHRNVQGLAWDGQNRLWSTEHGPSGFESGYDELNRIQKGGNYGWPLVRGDQTRAGLIAPIAQSGADDTWAPAGLAYADGSLYFAGLRSQTLYKAEITGETVTMTRHLGQNYGRLRAVTAQDGTLLIGTSNKDGRGEPKTGDDQILRVPLKLL